MFPKSLDSNGLLWGVVVPAYGDGRVLEESLGRVLPVDDEDEGLEDGRDVGRHISPCQTKETWLFLYFLNFLS